ncbi:MAG: Gfo/Idh/MocA family oxidoreductase [Candidatus Latescibacteria bacterium]|jgi:predicted dehydrogenase|nr:Gfo/Idh/MocA family oxidoreductase [Candidatus Latescibacterota bacterium]MBT4136967.1 Gfo/Idh/MocA family oxidoreductase [Candidatus Latescibacterota bacterium]MBT5830639.1 Gfo/Idh/MocA family oxidoreductase [Candidatus Latescibacterota bacterium]
MPNEKQKLRAVVAGWKWGANHLRAFAESDVCEVNGVWSRTQNDNAQRVADLFHVPLYTDYDKMLSEVRPDVASIATPERAHEALTLAALESGAHVYCEKVLSHTRESAQKMVDAANESGRLLNVGYNYRYSPSCVYLAEAIQAGKIGQPLFAHLRAFGFCIHHMTDYVNSLFGKPVRAVSVIDKEPLADKPHPSSPDLVFPTFMYCALTMKTYMIQYESGATLMAGATDYSSSLNPGATLLIEGTEGRLMLDDLSGKVTLLGNDRESVVYSPSQIRDSIGLRENCVLAVKDFARAVYADESAPIPGEAGVDMIALEEAVYKSATSGAWEVI